MILAWALVWDKRHIGRLSRVLGQGVDRVGIKAGGVFIGSDDTAIALLGQMMWHRVWVLQWFDQRTAAGLPRPQNGVLFIRVVVRALRRRRVHVEQDGALDLHACITQTASTARVAGLCGSRARWAKGVKKRSQKQGRALRQVPEVWVVVAEEFSL